MKNEKIAFAVLLYILIGGIFSIVPTFAQTTDSTVGSTTNPVVDIITSLLEQSNSQVEQKIQELDTKGIGIPTEINEIYQQGIEELQSSLTAIENGDLGVAENHALQAMSLFEDAMEDLFEAEEDATGVDFEDEEIEMDENVDDLFEHVEDISNSENEAEEIRNLISINNLDIGLGDFDTAIQNAKEFLANGDLENSEQQFEIAEDFLDDVYDQIEDSIDSNRDEKVREFVSNTIDQLADIILNANELGLSQSLIDELQSTLEVLQNSQDLDEVLDATDQDSQLNDLLNEFPGLVEQDEDDDNSGSSSSDDEEDDDNSGSSSSDDEENYEDDDEDYEENYDEEDDDNSGSGSSDDEEDDDNSGSGSSDDEEDDDNSGSGSSGDDD